MIITIIVVIISFYSSFHSIPFINVSLALNSVLFVRLEFVLQPSIFNNRKLFCHTISNWSDLTWLFWGKEFNLSFSADFSSSLHKYTKFPPYWVGRLQTGIAATYLPKAEYVYSMLYIYLYQTLNIYYYIVLSVYTTSYIYIDITYT